MEAMEQIYYWTGFVIIWLSSVLCIALLITFTLIQTFNELGKHYKNLWAIVEYAYYRHDFKDWIKDKDRHPKMNVGNKVCQDCGKEDDTIEVRFGGLMQCYKCFKDDEYFEDNYK